MFIDFCNFNVGFRSVWTICVNQLKDNEKKKRKEKKMNVGICIAASKFLPQCVASEDLLLKLDFSQPDFGVIDWENLYSIDHSAHTVDPHEILIDINFGQLNFGLMN